MWFVIKVPRRRLRAPHTVELDVKPPAPHQDSLLPKIHQAALACRNVQRACNGLFAACITPQHDGQLPVAIDGLDVIEGNEGGHWPLICEA